MALDEAGLNALFLKMGQQLQSAVRNHFAYYLGEENVDDFLKSIEGQLFLGFRPK